MEVIKPKVIQFVLIFIIGLFWLSPMVGQVDSNFVTAIYPTDMKGFYRDMEAYAALTEKDFKYLNENPVELLLSISIIGKVTEAEILNDIATELKERIIAATYSLYDFTPAYYFGEAVASTVKLNFTYTYTFNMPKDYELVAGEDAFTMELGTFIGRFSGNISQKLGLNGGAILSGGIDKNNVLVDLEVVIVGSKIKEVFSVPRDVTSESNQVLGLLGIGIGKVFPYKNGNDFRVKATFHYAVINLGVRKDDSVYKLNGFSPGVELSYNFKIGKTKKAYKAYQKYAVDWALQTYAGFQKLYLSGSEGDGNWYGLGLKFLINFRSLQRKPMRLN